jgi:hypothetical protein
LRARARQLALASHVAMDVPTLSLRQLAIASHKAAQHAAAAAERGGELAADAIEQAQHAAEAAERGAELAADASDHAAELTHEATMLAVNSKWMDVLANAAAAAESAAVTEHADNELSQHECSRSRKRKR